MRYADPTACPDCRRAIDPGTPSCPHCRLDLTGPGAAALFATLTTADRQLAGLPRVPVATGRPAADPGPVAPAGPVPDLPPFPRSPQPAPPAPAGARGSVVPKVLLGLGALCLLVASVVFLAVTWSVLGVTGRTLVLLTLTATAGLCTAWVSRHALRAAGESLLVVTAGLVGLDVVGIDRTGWFGATSGETTAIVLGTALLAVGVAAALLARRTPVERLLSAEIVAVLGTLIGGFGILASSEPHPVAGTLTALGASAAVGAGAARLRLPVLAWGGAGLAGLWWLVLVGFGLDRATTGPNLDGPTLAGVWGGVRIWPLLVAGLLAAALACWRRFIVVQVGAAAASVSVLMLTALLPLVDESLTVTAATGIVVLLLLDAVALRLPRTWLPTLALPALVAGAVAAAGTLTGLANGALPFVRKTDSGVWAHGATERVVPVAGGVPVWLILAGTAAAIVVLLSLPSLLSRVLGRPVGTIGGGPALHAVAVALAGAATLAGSGRFAVPLLVPAVIGVVVVLLLGLPNRWNRAGLVAPAAALVIAIVALVLTSAAQADSALLLAALSGMLVGQSIAGREQVRTAAWAALPLPLAGLVVSAVDLTGATTGATVAATMVALGGLLVVRAGAAVEIVTAVGALIVLAGGVADAGPRDRLALWLTLLGALLVAAGLRHGRAHLRWTGSGTLALALWARLADYGVATVEAYTLPIAVALLGYGLWLMHRRGLASTPALAAGLVLALTPSLVLALGDPVSLRALLLGIGCSVVLAAGAALRWSAPLVAGGVSLALLVLREATYADVLPQWVLIGAIGLALTLVGVTWERRLADLRSAADFVRRLR